MNEKLLKRLKSFAWRLGGLVVVTTIAFLLEPDMVNALELPHYLVVVLGLVANEVTKWLNNSGN